MPLPKNNYRNLLGNAIGQNARRPDALEKRDRREQTNYARAKFRIRNSRNLAAGHKQIVPVPNYASRKLKFGARRTTKTAVAKTQISLI